MFHYQVLLRRFLQTARLQVPLPQAAAFCANTDRFFLDLIKSRKSSIQKIFHNNTVESPHPATLPSAQPPPF